MKKFLTPICAAALLAALPLGADERSEHKLADAALAAGDYANAISGYRSAMRLADQADDPDAWAAAALKLGDACLRDGDLTGARAVYAEFRRRHPLRSAGILPGNLLAAEGKYAEAEQFFLALADGDPELADAARFSRGMTRLRAGDAAGARDIFVLLGHGNSPWAKQGRLEAVYALIRMGRPAEALAELGAIPAAERDGQWTLLRYLAEAYSGKTGEFKKQFAEFLDRQPPRVQLRTLELLSVAAAAAVRHQDHDFAVQCLGAARELAADETVKRDLWRRLINVYADRFPDRAAEEARGYVRRFPNAPDRGAVLNAAGRLLAGKGKTEEAWRIFTAVARDGSFPRPDRLAAAAEAVAAAGKYGSKTDPTEFYRMLGESSDTARERAEWRTRFGAFLEQSGRRADARREYLAALQTAPAHDREKLHFSLLNFFIRTGDEAGIRKEADYLSGSPEPRYQATAKFELGKLAERSGKFADARKFYREAGAVSGWDLTRESRFQSALMTLKLKEFAAAGKEFAQFAAENGDSVMAPNALYHAIEAWRSASREAEALQSAERLKTRYPKSEARAFYALGEAYERGVGGDLAGAIAELEHLEEDFNALPVSAEITLQKAVFMERKGALDDAVREFREILNDRRSAPEIAAESALHLGEILFRRGDEKQAKEMFLKSAALNPGGLFADVAVGRSVDCDLVRNVTPDPVQFRESIARCEQLAAATRYPQVRLQAFYKLGLCREKAGDYPEAVAAYEKLLYAAGEIVAQGAVPEAQWCIRGAEAALDIMVRHRLPGARARGARIIRLLTELRLPGVSGAEMRKKFREQCK